MDKPLLNVPHKWSELPSDVQAFIALQWRRVLVDQECRTLRRIYDLGDPFIVFTDGPRELCYDVAPESRETMRLLILTYL